VDNHTWQRRRSRLKKQIIVLVGPSGSGKTTIGEALTKKGLKKLVTTTTRKPRPGEKDGVDYYFREKAQLNQSDFIEQTFYNDNIYGLTKSEVKNALEDNDIVHVSLDRNGSKVMNEVFPEKSKIIFITVTVEAMKERMKKRGDSESKIAERIAHCETTGELVPPEEADYEIYNYDVDQTVEKILEIVNE